MPLPADDGPGRAWKNTAVPHEGVEQAFVVEQASPCDTQTAASFEDRAGGLGGAEAASPLIEFAWV
ncbi:hypothetical protein GCM10009753_52640 [Streptantibioticus ferralitis]